MFLEQKFLPGKKKVPQEPLQKWIQKNNSWAFLDKTVWRFFKPFFFNVIKNFIEKKIVSNGGLQKKTQKGTPTTWDTSNEWAFRNLI